MKRALGRGLVLGSTLLSLSACPREGPPKGGATAKTTPPAVTATASSAGAVGAGDRSGSSFANARPLPRGTSTTFSVPCSGAPVIVGPFSLTHDPERLVVRADAKGSSLAQVCVPDGHWVDAAGENAVVAGIPCVEGGRTVSTNLEYEYSPGNGGNAVNPVYWRVKLVDPKPAGCDTVTVTLALP